MVKLLYVIVTENPEERVFREGRQHAGGKHLDRRSSGGGMPCLLQAPAIYFLSFLPPFFLVPALSLALTSFSLFIPIKRRSSSAGGLPLEMKE